MLCPITAALLNVGALMTEDDFDNLEQDALDNYMMEKVMDDIFFLLAPLPWDQLPTLSDFLGD